jgi:hypothetical protein
MRRRCIASASRKPTTTPTAKPAAARRSEYHRESITEDSTVPPLPPATSCWPKTLKISERCGIEASSLRGRMSELPSLTPSSGMTSL